MIKTFMLEVEPVTLARLTLNRVHAADLVLQLLQLRFDLAVDKRRRVMLRFKVDLHKLVDG